MREPDQGKLSECFRGDGCAVHRCGDSFRADPPPIWSPTSVRGGSSPAISYDLHPDGKRLAAVAAQDQASGVQDKVVFVFNFADYLRKIAPGTK
jgi:hypothetical protein